MLRISQALGLKSSTLGKLPDGVFKRCRSGQCLKIRTDDPRDPANLGVPFDFIRRRLPSFERILESLNRHIQSDLASVPEAVSDRFWPPDVFDLDGYTFEVVHKS
jgi:hypothetical protein